MTSDPRLVKRPWTVVSQSADTLLIPLGSTEQHGPHLGLDVDSVIAESVALRAAAAVGNVVVAPTLHYGASGEHGSFAGTLSIGTEVLTSVLIELGRSADHFESVVFVCGHGGNADALNSALRVLVGEGRSVTAHVCGITERAAGGVCVPEGDAHAGQIETSAIMAISPEYVDLPSLREPLPGDSESTTDWVVKGWDELESDIREGGIAAVSPTGILGDPTGSSADLGHRYLAAMTQDLIATLERRGRGSAESRRRSPR